MKALLVNNTSGGPPLIVADLPRPEPGEGELLIRVHATGVTPTELHWYPTIQQKAEPHALAQSRGMNSVAWSLPSGEMPAVSRSARQSMA